MKVLRVLTGSHAGARLLLAPGDWRVQRLDPASESWQADEIALMDWQSDPLNLRVKRNDCVCIDAQQVEHPWPDFDVRRFGDVVLCIGEDSAIWPSDTTLLTSLVATDGRSLGSATRSAHESRPMAPQLVLRNVLVVAVAGMLLFPMVLLVFGPKSIQAAQSPPSDASAATFMSKVKQALHAEKLQGLEVRVAHGRLWVGGLVSDALEDALARKTLQPFDPKWVVSDWQTASQLSDTLTTALNEHGVQVRHVGGGHFVVEGRVAHPEDLRVKANKLKNDFANHVRTLEVRVQTQTSEQTKVSAMLETGGLHYWVRPDGSKSFTAQPLP